jgi:hypothetical protein
VAPLILGLALMASRAVAEPVGRCDGAAPLEKLGLPASEWQVACWRVEDGRQVVAAVAMPSLKSLVAAKMVRPATAADAGAKKPPPDPALVVELAVFKDGALVWRGQAHPDARGAPELREVLDKSEEWLIGIDDLALGDGRGVRVGVVGHWGGDAMSVREIALLYRLPPEGGAMRLVWSGLGNTRESRQDYCLIEGIATFQLVDDKTIERQMRLTPTINRETKLPRAKAKALEKKCTAEPQDPKRFPIAVK